jgi:hypothetical protein
MNVRGGFTYSTAKPTRWFWLLDAYAFRGRWVVASLPGTSSRRLVAECRGRLIGGVCPPEAIAAEMDEARA